MKVKQRVNGKEITTVWRQQDGATHFSTAGEGGHPEQHPSRTADIVELEPGAYSVLIDNRSYYLRLEHAHYGTFAQVGPWRVQLETASGGKGGGTKSTGGPAKILSAMPGRVVKVLVTDEQFVEQGDGILVLEAMKMQNEITAPRAGVVRSLSIREGDVVTAGALLARVE
jgi:biotin carboxyl carrier protein